MKKLFYSFLMLAAMSLTFVACEKPTPDPDPDPEPEVKSNCNIIKAQWGEDAVGGVYVFELFTNTLAITPDFKSITGSGDDCIIMLYAATQEDGYPVAGEYQFIAVENLTKESTNCLIGGTVQGGKPIGTHTYVVEDGNPVDGLLCTGGSIKFEGNATKGVMTANIEFTSVQTDEVVTRQYVFAGEMPLEYRPMDAPSQAKRIK
jgi:hypothetical protein